MVWKIKKIIKVICVNLFYIKYKLFFKKPNILSQEETINMIIKKRISVSRYGDGEFTIMLDKGKIGFQDYSPSLQQRLCKCFSVKHNNLLICIYNFRKNPPFFSNTGNWYRRFVYNKYRLISKFFDFSYLYGNAEISRFYYPDLKKFTDFDYIEKKYIPLLKKIWNNRNIIVVEGNDTKLGVGNDLFDNSKTIRRIICPSKNAFEKIESIKKEIIKHFKINDLVLIALGPTASILATELSVDYNIQCLDIGHIDVVYIWFLNKCNVKEKIECKYVNESDIDSIPINLKFNDKLYKKEIVGEIDG